MKRILALLLLILTPIALVAQTKVQGQVFEDSNGNGRLDRSEKGVGKVPVTNGKEVILTDKDGKYNLEIKEGDIISVIKPAGYSLPVNEHNLPQFFYIFKPNGSPNLKFPGVAPTGELPEALNFPLLPSVEKEEFSALIFGDPQPYTREQVEYFRKGIVSEIEKKENILFGLSLGDLVGNDLDLFKPYIKAVAEADTPWFNVIGNHDLNFDAETDELADETFEANFGPANFAFNYGKVHFIILDDILYPDPRDQKGYWGGLREDQLHFIENDLKHVPKEHLIVLAFHIPLSEPGKGDIFRDEDRNRLFEILKDYPHTLSLSAHTHLQRQDFLTAEEGWLREKPHHHYNVGTTSGNWYSGKLDQSGIPYSTMADGTPKGYAVINFAGVTYSVDYKVAGKSRDYQMNIFAPKVVARGKNTKAGIFVNFFMGSARDSVQYRVDDGEWKLMQRVERADPAFIEQVMEWDLKNELMPGRRPSDPVISTHLWRGSIPVKLEEGEHIIEVKAKDMFGRSFTQKGSYILKDPVDLPVADK